MPGSEFEGFVRNIGRKPRWSLGACLFPSRVTGPPWQPLTITNAVMDGPCPARNYAEPGAVLKHTHFEQWPRWVPNGPCAKLARRRTLVDRIRETLRRAPKVEAKARPRQALVPSPVPASAAAAAAAALATVCGARPKLKAKARPQQALVQTSVSAASSSGASPGSRVAYTKQLPVRDPRTKKTRVAPVELSPPPSSAGAKVEIKDGPGAADGGLEPGARDRERTRSPTRGRRETSVPAASSSGASPASRVTVRALGASDRERTRSPRRGCREPAQAEVHEDTRSCTAPLVTLSGGPCPNTWHPAPLTHAATTRPHSPSDVAPRHHF